MKGIPFELDSDYELDSDIKVKNILSQKNKKANWKELIESKSWCKHGSTLLGVAERDNHMPKYKGGIFPQIYPFPLVKNETNIYSNLHHIFILRGSHCPLFWTIMKKLLMDKTGENKCKDLK